mmetsp:Transcript_54295/g.117465  ORF Transcript_54295/g.117465 Transcript_54295/m.117465 type:complete len:363 (+) Transcript_54295:75-1163(+)
MSSSALIGHLLDPLIPPCFAEQDRLYDKVFGSGEDQIGRDYLRNLKRSGTYSLDWAGDKLLVATKDNSIRLYDPERGHESEERSWPGEWMSMQVDPNNPHVAAAVTWGGKLRVWDTRSSSQFLFDNDLRKSHSGMKEFLVLAWSPDSSRIAVNTRQDHVYMLDLRTPGTLRLGPSKNLQHEVNQMVWSADGEKLWVAMGGTPGRIHVLPQSLQTEGAPAVVAHQYTAISLARDPEGKHIASGGGDCLVALWDPRHLVCTRTFGFATQPVTTVGFNHNGNLIAWGTGGSGSTGGEKNLTIVGANTGVLYWQDSTPAPVQQVRWHPTRGVLAYTLNVAQLPEEDRSRRMGSGRDFSVVQLLKVP